MRASAILLVLFSATAALAADRDAFDAILRQRVSGDGLVDYAAIRDHDAAKLTAYLDELAGVDVGRLAHDAKLAHYLNLYNATMIKAVIDRLRDGYSPAENDFAVFKEPLVRLAGGKAVSLNHLEHEIIRKQFNEPRIHVALVCAAKSCPPLLNRAYRADDLDKVLEQNMKRFVTNAARNQIDDAKRELRLSKIFEWYAEDFGGNDAVRAYITKYAGKDVAGYRVSYLEYDWQLNGRPGA
jgi:hypothetical protein